MSGTDRLRNYALGLIAGAIAAGSLGYSIWDEAANLEKQIVLQAQKQAQGYAKPAYISHECKAADVAPSAQANCISAEREAASNAQRNVYDLEAQQTVAVWTRIMGKAAIIGLGVSILGLFLIFTTFWETRKAARAGFQANEIMRTSQRARVVVNGSASLVNWGGEVVLVVTAENVGHSIALQAVCRAIKSSEVPQPDFSEADPGYSHNIAAGGNADIIAFKDLDIGDLVSGIIEYRTIFSGPHYSLFCFEVFVSEQRKIVARPIKPAGWPDDT